MNKYFFYITLALITAGTIISCAKDRATPDTSASALTDAKLYDLAKDTTDYYYYADGSSATQFLTTSNSSPFHGNIYYELKMNKTAKDACTSGGKLPASGTFPDSSLVVKQIHASPTGPVTEYAVLYKLKGSWNWARYSPAGDVLFSINGDANANCISCHQPSSRDFVRTFDEHP